MKKKKFYKISTIVLVLTMLMLTSLSVCTASQEGLEQEEQTGVHKIIPGLVHRQWYEGKLIINSGPILTWVPGAGFEIAGYWMLFECLRDGEDHELYLEGGIGIYLGGPFMVMEFPPYTEDEPLTWGGSGYLWLRYPHWCPYGAIVESIDIDFDVYLDGEYVGDYIHHMVMEGSSQEPL